MPPPHPLAQARNPESLFYLLFFLVPHLMHHSVPTILSLKHISNVFTTAQLLWHHPQTGHHPLSSVTARIILFGFSLPFLPLPSPTSPPSMAPRVKPIILNPTRFAPCLPWPSPLLQVFASCPAHSSPPLHKAESFSSFKS